MAENKTQVTKQSVAAFLKTLVDAGRIADAKKLVVMLEIASGEKAKMWGPAIVGCGSHHYVYESGREGDMPLVAFSPRATAFVLYVGIRTSGASALLARLGKHKVSGGCLHIKKLAEVDLAVLAAIIEKGVAVVRD